MKLVMVSGSSLKSGVKEEEIMNNTDIYLVIHVGVERKGKGSRVQWLTGSALLRSL